MQLYSKKKIISTGKKVQGTITQVKALNWFTVNTQNVRKNNANAKHPHKVYFTYKVDDTQYVGKAYKDWTAAAPSKNQPITVFVDNNDPRKFAVER